MDGLLQFLKPGEAARKVHCHRDLLQELVPNTAGDSFVLNIFFEAMNIGAFHIAEF